MTTELYKDVNFNFRPHPISGDVGVVKGEEAIRQSLENIIQTVRYERPFQPRLHGSIQSLLFEPATPAVTQKIESDLARVIENFEPRIEQVQVQVQLVEDDKYKVVILFRLRTSTETQQVQTFLQRA